MKTYLDILAETTLPSFGDRDICWYLKQPSYDVLRNDIAKNPNQENSTKGMHISVTRFLRSLLEWKQGSTLEARRQEIDNFARDHIMSCDPSSRAPWTKHVGKVYRGLMKTQSTIQSLKLSYSGEIVTITSGGESFPALTAVGVYRSAYRYQSWTTFRGVAHEFATGGAQGMMTKTGSKIGMILEIDLKSSDNSLYIDTFPRMGREHEVIVESKGSVPVVVYVNLNDITTKVLTMNKARNYTIDTEKSRKILGKSHDVVAKSPQISAFMKRKYGIDFNGDRG